jgi:hypothetical protein
MRGRKRDEPNIYTMRGLFNRIKNKNRSGTKPAIAKNVPTPAKDDDELAHALLGLLRDIRDDKLD